MSLRLACLGALLLLGQAYVAAQASKTAPGEWVGLGGSPWSKQSHIRSSLPGCRCRRSRPRARTVPDARRFPQLLQ